MSGEHRLLARRALVGVAPDLRVAPALITIGQGAFTRIDVLSAGETPEPPFEDLGDALVAPALVNGHTHLALAALRGLAGMPEVRAAFRGNVVESLFFQLEPRFSADDVAAFCRVGALECLLGGQAVVWDHYYHPLAVAEAVAGTGLGLVMAPTLQDRSGPGTDAWERNLAATQTLSEDAQTRRGVFAAVGPHATDTVSDRLFAAARDLATELRIPAHLHLAQSHEEVARSQADHGVSPVQRLIDRDLLPARSVLAHGIFVDDHDLDRLSAARHTLAFCPHSQLRFCFPADLRRWHAANIPWLVATDAAACNDSMNVQAELRLVAGLGAAATASSVAQRAFSDGGGPAAAGALEATRQGAGETWPPDPGALLASITSTPGACHPAFRAGALCAGYQANLLLLDPDHPAIWPGTDPVAALVYADAAPAISRMMVRGRWLSAPGEHQRGLFGDEQKAMMQEARERLAHHLNAFSG